MLLDDALEFAGQAHKEQKYGQEPYRTHLEQVISVLRDYDVQDEEILAAGALHDVVEDTDVQISEIEGKFGGRVARLVWAVTSEGGKNRRERNSQIYAKVRSEKGAVLLKLADRIANLRNACRRQEKKYLLMYKKEQKVFRERLENKGATEEKMWAEIDSIFRALERDRERLQPGRKRA